MRFLLLAPTILILFLSIIIGTSCTTDSHSTDSGVQLDGTFKKRNLENKYINTIKAKNGTIYAATRNDLLKLSPIEDNNWTSLNLKSFINNREVRDFIIFGKNNLLAGIGSHPKYQEGTTPLWKTTTAGEQWEPSQNGFGDEKGNYNAFTAIDAVKNSDTLYAMAGGAIARSDNKGKKWKLVYGSWDSASFYRFIHVDKNNSENIWAGGGNNIFQPVLLKSTNKGDSWTSLKPLENAESDVYDIAIHPKDPDIILVGMGGAVASADVIRKSLDGGKNWKTVYKSISTLTFTHSARTPETVYASGRNQAGTLFFAASGDFGDSWKTVEWENSPAGVQVNDMVSVMENGHEVLYFGTNKGVYSYRFEE